MSRHSEVERPLSENLEARDGRRQTNSSGRVAPALRPSSRDEHSEAALGGRCDLHRRAVNIFIAQRLFFCYSRFFTSFPCFGLFERYTSRIETCTLVELSPAPSLPGPSDPTRAHHQDAPWSQRHPSAVRLEALTSPPRPGSQDYPTVPGYPVAAAVLLPTSHAATQRSKVATSI